MRLALDATPLIGSRTGVATFTAGALHGLVQRRDLSVLGYALSWRGRTALREVLPEGVDSGWSVPASPLLRLWAHTALVPVEWIADDEEGIDVVHGTNFVVPPARSAARVVTIHDLTCVRFPELCTPSSLRYPALIRRAIRTGAWVHTPSAHVADEVCEAFDADPARVRAVHHGLGWPGEEEGPPPTQDSEPTWAEGGAPREPDGQMLAAALTTPQVTRYVLALGTLEPRKDFPLLIRAFDRIAGSHSDLGLVIAGPPGWGSDAVTAACAGARHRDRIGLAGYVDGDVRRALLGGASVFAFPSLYEGFGLPPLEAMAAGVPVVASAAGAVPEVCGDAALLVQVGAEEAFAAALETLVDQPSPELVARGWARADGFTWERCAEGLRSLYADAVAGG